MSDVGQNAPKGMGAAGGERDVRGAGGVKAMEGADRIAVGLGGADLGEAEAPSVSAREERTAESKGLEQARSRAGAATGAAADSGDSQGEGAALIRRYRFEFLYFAVRNNKLLIGLGVVCLFVLVAIFGPLFTHYPPLLTNAAAEMKPPSGQHWLGTTYFGQDVFSQFVYGTRATFMVGALGGGFAAIVGMLIGFTAGYRGGIVDEVLNMLTNVVLVIPSLALLLIIGGYLKSLSEIAEGIFVGLTTWPWAARAIRAQTFSLKQRDFVGLARLSGERSWKIILREIAPNMSSYLFLTFILLFGGAILVAAGIDFLGFGPSNQVTLGTMMNQAFYWNALQLHIWWWFIPPGAAMTAIVGGLYLTNVGLDEVFNPKLREL